MEQYREVKRQHPQDLLMFRLGDFYELFFEDAELAARELEITLTSREAGNSNRVPMCGVPYHAVDGYLTRLVAKGYRVAICEQVEDPKTAKGIVRREVVRVVTPGTILSEAALNERGNNYLALVCESGNELALAVADISTGEFLWALFAGSDRYPALLNQLTRLIAGRDCSDRKIGPLGRHGTFYAKPDGRVYGDELCQRFARGY